MGQNENPNPNPNPSSSLEGENRKTQEENKGEIEKKLGELITTTRELEGRLQNLQSTAFQLANYYFVFQGVILTSICSGTSSLTCSDRWFLSTLSLLAAILNLTALSIIGLKYKRIISQRDENWSDCNELERRLRTVSPLDAKKPSRIQIGDPCKELVLNICFAACMVLFLAFAGVTLSGCWHIICRKNESKIILGNDECIKLCEGGRCMRVCTLNSANA